MGFYTELLYEAFIAAAAVLGGAFALAMAMVAVVSALR